MSTAGSTQGTTDAPTDTPRGPRSGIDTSGIDRSVRPQDDLFGFVNGTWVARTQIPDDKGRYGTFDQLRDQSQEQVRDLLEEASRLAGPGSSTEGGESSSEATGEDEGHLRELVGALYGSFMDAERVQALGAGERGVGVDEHTGEGVRVEARVGEHMGVPRGVEARS